MRREHRQRKRQMKSLLSFVVDMQDKVEIMSRSKSDDTGAALNRLITVDLDKADGEAKEQRRRQHGDALQTKMIKGTSATSGLINSLLIGSVHGVLEGLAARVSGVENGEEKLFQAVVNAVEGAEKHAGRREDAKGVHFIESGEVLVVGKGC